MERWFRVSGEASQHPWHKLKDVSMGAGDGLVRRVGHAQCGWDSSGAASPLIMSMVGANEDPSTLEGPLCPLCAGVRPAGVWVLSRTWSPNEQAGPVWHIGPSNLLELPMGTDEGCIFICGAPSRQLPDKVQQALPTAGPVCHDCFTAWLEGWEAMSEEMKEAAEDPEPTPVHIPLVVPWDARFALKMAAARRGIRVADLLRLGVGLPPEEEKKAQGEPAQEERADVVTTEDLLHQIDRLTVEAIQERPTRQKMIHELKAKNGKLEEELSFYRGKHDIQRDTIGRYQLETTTLKEALSAALEEVEQWKARRKQSELDLKDAIRFRKGDQEDYLVKLEEAHHQNEQLRKEIEELKVSQELQRKDTANQRDTIAKQAEALGNQAETIEALEDELSSLRSPQGGPVMYVQDLERGKLALIDSLDANKALREQLETQKTTTYPEVQSLSSTVHRFDIGPTETKAAITVEFSGPSGECEKALDLIKAVAGYSSQPFPVGREDELAKVKEQLKEREALVNTLRGNYDKVAALARKRGRQITDLERDLAKALELPKVTGVTFQVANGGTAISTNEELVQVVTLFKGQPVQVTKAIDAIRAASGGHAGRVDLRAF